MTLDLFESALSVVQPLERLSPSGFAAKYRFLKEGTTAQPGLWSPDVFPYLNSIMDCVQEAVEAGKNFVLMKSGQGGGSEAMINALLWFMTYYPGPHLYLISKDDTAKEFARDRFSYANLTCEPIARKHLGGRSGGELVATKRYTDGKLTIAGGRSMLNLISNPQRSCWADEADALQDTIGDSGDVLKNLEIRVDAYKTFGATLIAAFAHPSSRERGVGRLYYTLSDQRRGFVQCPHCRGWHALEWRHVKSRPRGAQSATAAERDPSSYRYVAPCCGAEWTDSERYRACENVEQRSTLSPGAASRATWIGCHFSQLMMRKPIRWLASQWIECLDDPEKRRVFVNKRMGDVDDSGERDVTAAHWGRLKKSPETPGAYSLGQLPPGVRFLTAGQDSRLEELHWAVWGWGLSRTAEMQLVLCGWLIDFGKEAGPQALDPARRSLDARDLRVFDQILYGRSWSGEEGELSVALGFHDSGWMPTAIYEYVRTLPGRAIPSKGAALDDRSENLPIQWRPAPKFVTSEGETIADESLRLAELNTWRLKGDFVSLTEKTWRDPKGQEHPRIALPTNTPGEFLEHLASERVVRDAKGKRRWVLRHGHATPNHWFDCSILAFAAALNLESFAAQGMAHETAAQQDSRPGRESQPRPPWATGERGGKWW